MFQIPPSVSSRPPVMLVKTWLELAGPNNNGNSYSKKRAIDLLQLLFGSIEFAERYVRLNEKNNSQENNKVISGS